jgi:hypothetical protein
VLSPRVRAASERRGRSGQPQLIHSCCLGYCRVPEIIQVDAAKLDVRPGKCRPEGLLATNANEERLEFDNAAQWRALEKSAVWFQPSQAFCYAHETDLHCTWLDLELPHDVLERFAIAGDVTCDRMMRAERSPRQFNASRSRCVMVAEVDPQPLIRHARMVPAIRIAKRNGRAM